MSVMENISIEKCIYTILHGSLSDTDEPFYGAYKQNIIVLINEMIGFVVLKTD